MDHTLTVLLLLCSPGLQAEEPPHLNEQDYARLEQGTNRCDGTLEIKKQNSWRPVNYHDWTLKEAAEICKHLDCGSAVFTELKRFSPRAVWKVNSDCMKSGNALKDCLESHGDSSMLHVTCAESIRLVNGSSLCSGRLEVKSDQTWSSVCEADFDQQDAEVVCREIGCGPPSVLQGGLYGDGEAPTWTKEFQCGGVESSLLDCRSSDSDRNTCSPGRAVGLTCSEPFRFSGGASRCSGMPEVKHNGDWRTMNAFGWTLKVATAFCRELNCGSAVSGQVGGVQAVSWTSTSECIESGTSLRECIRHTSPASSSRQITCTESIRLVNGSSLCSGRLEVKSDQTWSSVCEADFDQQDAEVVCREIGCGPPSVLQVGLYGDGEAPTWTKEFQCGGVESSLLDCRSSDSDRNTCSPGRAVGLTCSEPIRLVGRMSHCSGRLEMKLDSWRPVTDLGRNWTLTEAAMVCRQLDCGSAVAVEFQSSHNTYSWIISSGCVRSGTVLRECAIPRNTNSRLTLFCSDPPVQTNRYPDEEPRPTAEELAVLPDRSEDMKSHPKVSVFTPVFIFTLVLLVLSLTFFISALGYSYKVARDHRSEPEMETELKTHQQT